jgi:tRNA-Thr(GGU) m(6)t(6)A37 methyltransferase TsaA
MELVPIGRIRSDYKTKEEAPRQGRLVDNISTIEIFDDYVPGIKEVKDMTHMIVLYWQDQSNRKVIRTKTPFSTTEIGVFATRSPNRPNPIAFCVCEVVEVSGSEIKVKYLDALDGSSLVDLKVYSAELDSYPEAKSPDKKLRK